MQLINEKGAKYQQELTFTNARGVVADLPDDMVINGDDTVKENQKLNTINYNSLKLSVLYLR